MAWNTVSYLDDSSSSVCQNADLKSIFENHLHPASFALMSSCCGMGWLVGIMALLTLHASSVILIEWSVFGAITAFETHGAGWFIGCFSMISWFIISGIILDTCSLRWYGTERGVVATGFTSVFTCNLIWWFLSLPMPQKLGEYSARQDWISPLGSVWIILIGAIIPCLGLNSIIPRAVAEFPARIGSQFAAIICHLTGTEFDPNVTTQIACLSTLIGSLLNGFNFVFVENILSVIFNFLACSKLQTLTLAPVSVITVVKVYIIYNYLNFEVPIVLVF